MDGVQTSNKAATVPDLLLSLSKDERYISQTKNLITQVVAPYIPKNIFRRSNLPATSNEGDQPSFMTESLDRIQPELDFLARIIHCLLLLRCNGQSLGMAYAGLSYWPCTSSQRKVNYAFQFIYTVMPYIKRRVGGNGWNDISQIIHSIKRSIRFNNAYVEGDDLSISSPMDMENLRGVDRRKMYEEMRMKMLQRAVNTKQHETTSIESKINMNTRTYERCRELVRNVLNTAHDSDKATAMLKWIMRINLSLFYINGQYPTILHRLCGVKFYNHTMGEDVMSTSPSVRLVAMRPSYQILGLIILLEGGTKLVEAATTTFLDILHRFQTKWRKQQRSRSALSHLKGREHVPSSQLEPFHENLESFVQGRHSSDGRNGTKTSGRGIDIRSAIQNENQCGICKNELTHPAALAGCGHVFCWSCISHWLVSVKEKCPICRSRSALQELIPLHNYH